MKIRLKKIQIYGFKSFAEKTQFLFDKNIIGIVGPNGCGKSNIVDAIYWVFQSHSLKTLRANEKQDLIFKGNDIKPPAGFAEVELIFNVVNDNETNDNNEDIINDEFSIKKRLYPSGEIIYYLNKKEVKPKDIHNLLLNYSITTIDYSIIAQGSVSKIIDMRPEDRVEMIESAAGIKNIKNERAKAFIDLNKTEENLKSILLLSKELEDEVNKLRIQADKARLYKESNDNIVFAEQGLQIIKYKKLIESINKLEHDFEQSNENLKKIDEKTLLLDNEKNQINQKIKDLESSIEEKRKKIFQLESDISVIEKTIVLSQKRYEELEIEKRRKMEDLNFFKNRIKKIDELLSFPIEELDEELEQELEKKENIEKELYKIDNKISDLNSNIERLNKEIKINEKDLKELYKIQEEFLNEEISTLFSNLYLAKMKVLSIFSNAKNLNELTSIEKTKLEGIKNRLEDIIKFCESYQNKQISFYIIQLKDELEKIKIDSDEISSKISIILKESNEFENLLFGKDSLFSKFHESNDEIAKIDEKLELGKNNLSNLQQELALAYETRNNSSIRLEEINRKIFQIEEKVKLYKLNKSRYENEKVELLYNSKLKEEEIIQIEQNMEKIKSEAIDLLNEKDKIFSNKREIDLNIREISKEIDKYREELTRLLIENESIIKERNNIISLKEEFNISRAKLQTQCESIKMIFFENYRMILNEEFLSQEKFNNLKESELRNLLYESRKSIEEIGQVNFLAIDEYQEVSKRYDFICKQREDIMRSKEKIIEIIKELDLNLREKFMEAFNKINENFKNIFCEVFKGGNASMILTNPDNIFETGIEIIIQPPGKNISNISLLSGGETAMSSISLLFAFFLYCPSPFCIMDEVDAPFDENNVMLFKRLIQRFSKDTQFFLISHNKLTLDIADILYGITMEDDGISKVVSVKLEDVKDPVI